MNPSHAESRRPEARSVEEMRSVPFAQGVEELDVSLIREKVLSAGPSQVRALPFPCKLEHILLRIVHAKLEFAELIGEATAVSCRLAE